MLDFSPVDRKEMKLSDLAEKVSIQDLRAFTHESVDFLLNVVRGLSDEELRFIPVDASADDPFASNKADKVIGWSVAHLILHVTASSEEGAAFASILGRGLALGGRLRYEPDWKEERFTSQSACIHRLEESRRMRLGYLDAIPDTPHTDTYRELSPTFEAYVGKLNYMGSFLLGLWHEVGHYAQIQEAAQQAKAALIVK